MQLELTLRRVAKNGMAVYKFNTKRSSGTVYFDKKMFNGAPPQTVKVDADNLAEPIVEAPKPAAAETASANTASSTDAPASA